MKIALSPPVRAVLAVLFVLAASSATAQPREVSCKALADRLLAGRTTAETKVTQDGQTCAVTNLKIAKSRYQGWTIERLTVTGPDFRRLEKGQLFPTALRVEALGVRFAPDIEDTHSRYLIQAQQRPLDARLDYAWDKATQRLHLRELAVEGSVGGLFAVSMDADLADLDTRTTLPGPKDLGVRRARLVFDNGGLFESLLLPVILGLVPADKDPAAEIPKAQAREKAKVRALPSSTIDEASKDALSRFIDDFPHPRGHFEIDQTFDAPLRLTDPRALADSGMSLLTGGSRIVVRYDPSASRAGNAR
jgi:hypothetical protein